MTDNDLAADYYTIPDSVPGGFFIYNAQEPEEIVYADANVIKLFGCTDIKDFRAFTNNSFMGMVYHEDLYKIENAIQSQTLHSGKRHDYVRYRIQTKDNKIRYVEDFGHLVHSPNGKSYFYVFIVDMDKDEYFNHSNSSFAEEHVFALSRNNDLLTGLFNMRYFHEEVQKKLFSREDRLKGMAFVHFDIASFKLFNERYGFQKGDELLCDVSAIIHQAFPEHFAARLSNDHFIVCTHAPNVEELVEDVYKKVKKIIPGVRIELKAGIYYLEDTCDEAGFACDRARLACNNIKQHYDVHFAVYDTDISRKLRTQQYIADHIDEAIENDFIKVFYQPVIRVATGEICGYEALARWQDPVHGMLSPQDFIETLENFHLIHKLDSYIVHRVCADYNKLSDAGEPVVPVSVNLSRLDFQLCNIFDIVNGYCEKYNMPKYLLDIEITESSLNDTTGALKYEIDRFRANGYQIWIDDFGSGYSSLNVLSEYSFDLLKLDMKFLRSMKNNPNAGTLLYYIVYAAQEMGLQALTEGVETQEHFDFLKKVGCNKAQGYLFSKPLPLEECREFTRAKGMQWETSEP
ncbi:MAG: GGDEF and EAL domain-containing protein [Treponema sp.]|nr:GGDEF and EAL domain-containing protein [Treponema sp.]